MKENNGEMIDERYQQWREEIRQINADLDAGHGIEINSDEELAAFFDEIESEVRSEMADR
jgi:hypothetical protein